MSLVTLGDLLQKGLACHTAGRLQEAEKIYRQILAQVPEHPDATHFMGVLAYNVGKNDVAKIYLRKAIALMPENSACYCNMGNVFQHEKAYAKSMVWYKMSIELNPQNQKAHSNLGVAYLRLGKLEKALKSIETAISIDPEYTDALVNYGETLKAMGDYDKSLDAYDRAIAISPESVDAHWNRSIIWLTKGNFRDGWPEYEWRWRRPTTRKRMFATGTLWQGQPIAGKTLFVFEEQGLGDTIQFVRFLPMLKPLGCRVIFEVGFPLIRLMNDTKLYDRLWVGLKDVDTRPVDRFDFYAPLLSLPGILKTEVKTIPAHMPYLKADLNLCRIWKGRMARDNSFKVGLVWAGHPDHNNDAKRSIPLQMFQELAHIKGVSFYSLQKDKHDQWTDMDSLKIFEKDFGPEISDFADTAAIIENLDLVISVDTSVVHLAGALGKPVWTLIPFEPDFRWLLDREDSPWYPTMKLFRQPGYGAWEPVLKRVAQALSKKIQG